MNVPDFLDPRKEAGYIVYAAALFILVALGAFGLGRLSALPSSQAGLRVVGADEGVASVIAAGAAGATAGENPGGKVVASKTGSKYHFPWCAGARTIKESNKVWFQSAQEARKAGYEPAGNCKGLE